MDEMAEITTTGTLSADLKAKANTVDFHRLEGRGRCKTRAVLEGFEAVGD